MSHVPMHGLYENIQFDFDIDELARTIACSKAVVYTGGGTSFAAGLPGWVRFLEKCLERSQKKHLVSDWWDKANSLLKEGDYLTCAGLIQSNIGHALEQYIWDNFGLDCEPTEIHKAIVRIPFSLAITTNYDRLLESAYPSRPNVWTWRDPEALFCSIKHRRFGVVKIHGDVGNGPSLVLTRNQYRDLMHLNKAFNDCLMTLLTLRSFLFIGSSLKDQDLMRLMDMAKLTFGAEYGPHYAVTFTSEVDSSLAEFLRDSYNLHCVSIAEPEGDRRVQIEQYGLDWRTSSVCSFLKFLSGKVTQFTSSSLSAVKLENATFNLRSAAQELTGYMLKNTASNQCRLAYVRDPKLPSLCLVANASARRQIASCQDPFREPNRQLSPESYMGKFFRMFGDEANQNYVGNVAEYRATHIETEQQEFDGIVGFADSNSTLMVPIRADSEKIGVLAVESSSIDAYTCDHLHGLQSMSKAAGAVYLEYRHRQACADSIRVYLQNLDTFQEMMNKSRQLEDLDVLYILYEIDYASGKLIARHSRTKFPTIGEGEFCYSFEESALATLVLQGQKADFIPDAHEDLASPSPKLSRKGVDRFNISGPVYATPIKFNGSIATILVCWSNRQSSEKGKLVERIVRERMRIFSLATLLTNSPETVELNPARRRSDQFITELDKSLFDVDKGRNWTGEQLRSEDFRERVIEVALRALVAESCGLRRVRFWLKSCKSPIQFELHKSICSGMASRTGSEEWDRYKSVTTNENDPYCRYTIARAIEQPLAEFQHMSMFGVEDTNWKPLNKCKDGVWIVAPIVAHGDICGFISADNHIQVQQADGSSQVVEERVPEQVRELQRCAIDVIVRLIENLVHIMCVHREFAKKKNEADRGT